MVGCAAVVAVALTPTTGSADDNAKILDWDTMTGVVGPFRGAANPIRGVNGGGLAWMIERGKGTLRADGEIDVHVRGLVFAEGANAGRNTVASFKAIVSCLTVDVSGAVATWNVSTKLFPATIPGGDARIRDEVDLPKPCIAPIVFVTNPGGAWFAATGHD
jgi:hypothetical protein